ncbi:DUF58 domain-containing protein [Pelagibacterium luteolum]|uniref:DUF58 domain-containing protein n=1 Tax=Pelagibacterium luteolum TaxID=440168 RepID=A0A1G7XYL3_9HYPH|nr:DUF58 domain-containing protein [Pelagibacterium luteolum]SDG89274.1 Protein of unknown function DUF58 [Pelagibacterium luteolum]
MKTDVASKRSMPSPDLIDRLSAMRLAAPAARARRGIGERASRMSGPGMEFADFRTYRAGDDLRHVDPRSIAHGTPVTRKYVQRQQILVTIVLDLTPSMMVEDKAALAKGIARALGFVTLAAQDRLRIFVLDENPGLKRSPTWHGRARVHEMIEFAEPRTQGPGGPSERTRPDPASLSAPISDLIGDSDAGSIVFILSDFWGTGLSEPLAALTATGAMVIAMHILAASERDPSSMGNGIIRLVDAETGRERDMALDDITLTAYHAAMSRHTDGLREALIGGNVYLPVAAEETLSDVCLKRLTAAGIIV